MAAAVVAVVEEAAAAVVVGNFVDNNFGSLVVDLWNLAMARQDEIGRAFVVEAAAAVTRAAAFAPVVVVVAVETETMVV